MPRTERERLGGSRARSRRARAVDVRHVAQATGPRAISPVSEADIAVDHCCASGSTASDPGYRLAVGRKRRRSDRASTRVRCGSSIRSTAPAPISPACRTGRCRRRWSRTAGRSWPPVMRRSTSEFFMAVAGQRRDLQRRADRGDRRRRTRGRARGRPEASCSSACARSPRLHDDAAHPLAGAAARPRRRRPIDAAFAGGNSHDWDLAAADLLVHEAGGALTTFGGGQLDL